jgi:hypothetical protein
MAASTKLTGYLILGAAAYWLWQQQQPTPPLKPPADPQGARSSAVNPRYRAQPLAPNGALPQDTEDAFPKLPFSVLLQGGPGPGRATEPTLNPWGQHPAYSQPVGPEFEPLGRRKI